MTKLANVVDMGMSNEIISTVSNAEKIVSDLKGINKDNVASINDSKINGQYVPFIAHVAKFPRTASGNVSPGLVPVINRSARTLGASPGLFRCAGRLGD